MRKLLCLSICLPVLVSLGHAGVVLPLPAGDVGPVTVFDSITGAATYAGVKLGPPETSNYTGLYSSFSTGTSFFDLQDVNLVLSPSGVQPSEQGATLSVDLFSDNSLTPGTELDTIGTTTDLTVYNDGLGVYNFTSNIELNPNTRYWIEVVPSGSTTSWWEATQNLSGTGGVASEYLYTTHATSNTTHGYAEMMELSGLDTPEPSTILLAILGLGAVVLFGRRSAFRGASR